MKKLLLGTAMSLVAVAGAVAADLPPAPAPVPFYSKAPPPMWTWTGFYIGANGGYGWSPANTVSLTNPPLTVNGVVGPGSATGGFGGGQVGYNWQIGAFVLGAEADVQGASIKGSSGNLVIDPAGDVALSNQNLNFFYTVRGRAGLAFDRALVYFTGGFAGGTVNDTILVTNPAVPGTSATLVDSTSRSGYVLGGGLEYAFDRHWSLKGEYQYLNLGSGILSGPVLPGPGTITSTSVKDTFQTVRGGINFRF